MDNYRNKTRKVQIGDVCIGGGEKIAIQSMTNTKTEDVEACVAQILRLEKAGCDIIRVAVPTMEAAESISKIKKQIHIPLVADIHFDYRLAIAAIENGADKIRINPGNIGDEKRVRAVVEKAKEYHIPIRVGVNSGSLEKHLVEKYHGVTAEGLVESALDKVHLIENMGYDNLVVSIKSSDVMMCVKAHELLAPQCPYPLHVGITESGTLLAGNIKSSIGLGLILSQGIGDTIRVSLTGDPVEEIKSAKLILKTLGLRKGGIEVVSCPTCGRTKIDLIGLANKVETMVAEYPLDIKVAVMGCVVNGPGEAREADLGIAGGIGEGLLIKKGEIIRKVKETVSIPVIMKIGKNYSNIPSLVNLLKVNGADGVVLFNRFYQPDIDINNMQIVSGNVFSNHSDLSDTIRWTAIVSGKIPGISIASSTGVHDWEDVVKCLLAGASAVQMCSAVYTHGAEIISQVLTCVEEWMHQAHYQSLSQFQGKLNYANIPNPAMYERSQFMKYFSNRD